MDGYRPQKDGLWFGQPQGDRHNSLLLLASGFCFHFFSEDDFFRLLGKSGCVSGPQWWIPAYRFGQGETNSCPVVSRSRSPVRALFGFPEVDAILVQTAVAQGLWAAHGTTVSGVAFGCVSRMTLEASWTKLIMTGTHTSFYFSRSISFM